ncbi:PREDICTED: synaptotagmin-12-like, partial [Rhagoletis zephyria]
VFKDSVTPSYNETFNFWLKKQHGRHSLWFHLYHNGDAHTLIGEAEMEIGEMPRSVTTWIPLTDSRKCNAQWGELMFSLSYLPTAERLTIVIVKARNLKMEIKESGKNGAPQEVQSVFVKVYLMNNEKKVLKKRTSLKRRDRCPIFNESMIFSVPPPSLTTVQLRLTVFGVTDAEDGAPRIAPIGHVIAGACATGKGLRHWHQMLSSLRKPVAMWHVLRRASYQPIFTGGAEAVVAAMQSTALRAKRNSII